MLPLETLLLTAKGFPVDLSIICPAGWTKIFLTGALKASSRAGAVKIPATGFTGLIEKLFPVIPTLTQSTMG